MYICKYIIANTFRIIDTFNLKKERLQNIKSIDGYITINKDIKKESLEEKILGILEEADTKLEEKKYNELEISDNSQATYVNDTKALIPDNKTAQMNIKSDLDIYNKICITLNLWRSLIPVDSLKEFIRPIIQKFYKDIKPDNDMLAALLEKYVLMKEPQNAQIDEGIMVDMEREVSKDTMAHFKIALNYHHRIKHLPFSEAFNISIKEVDCGSFIETALQRIADKKNAENKEKVRILEDEILKYMINEETIPNTKDSSLITNSKALTPNSSKKNVSIEDNTKKDTFNVILNGKQYNCKLGDTFESNINERKRRVIKYGEQVMIFLTPSEVMAPDKTEAGVIYSIIGEGKNPRESQIFGSNGNGFIRYSKGDIYLFVEENTKKYRLHDIVRYVDYEEIYEKYRSVIYFKLKSCTKY